MGFSVHVSDPPWMFKDSLPGSKRGASKHYGCMSLIELMSFEQPAMLDDSILFMWRVASMPTEALCVVRSWGFEPKSELVWIKTDRSGNPSFGMGHYVRGAHETCIIATRGHASKLIKNRSVRSVFLAPRGSHSAKPDEFYSIVESLVDGPYVETFARRNRPGWTCFGDEL